MRRFVPASIRRLRYRVGALDRLDRMDTIDSMAIRLDHAVAALGRIEARQLQGEAGPLQRHEFKVFSHAGEDGIIDFLVNEVAVPSQTFVEFGVEDYQEANTRFLLIHRGWSGFVMDGDSRNIERIRRDPVFWNSDLKAEAAFVTRENVNDLLTSAGFTGDLGLLSIDVDGNDYWILDAIEVVRPAILVVEYNHRFGAERSVTIPYDPAFARQQTDATWLFAGASLSALTKAASRKGMSLVGCNTFGNNAFFVRTDLLTDNLPEVTVAKGYAKGRFSEPIIRDGTYMFATAHELESMLAAARLVDVE